MNTLTYTQPRYYNNRNMRWNLDRHFKDIEPPQDVTVYDTRMPSEEACIAAVLQMVLLHRVTTLSSHINR